MFVGALPSRLATYIGKGVAASGFQQVAVGCSGNFTVERALVGTGVRVRSNDLSLYTTALGRAICDPAGPPTTTPFESWLEPYCQTALDLFCTVLTLSGNWDWRECAAVEAKRFAVQRDFPAFHAKTMEKLGPTLRGLREVVQDYYCGDVGEHFVRNTELPKLAFFPTYAGSYDKLWRKLDSFFRTWERPDAPLLNKARIETLAAEMIRQGAYVYVSDTRELGERVGARLACTFDREGKKRIYVWSDFLPVNIFSEKTNHAEGRVKVAHFLGDPAKIGLALLSSKQAFWVRDLLTHNQVRKLALNPIGGMADIGIVGEDGLIGAIGIVGAYEGLLESRKTFLMYDLAVPGLHPRLSKLMLSLTLAAEVQTIVARTVKHPPAESIVTKVFTDKPVSMKYRGVYELTKREPGMLAYTGLYTGRKVSDVVGEWWKKYGMKT